MKHLTSLFLVALLASGQVFAQAEPPEEEDPATSGGWTYIGDDKRVGVGIDDDGDFLGEFMFLLTEDYESAWLAEGWVGDGGAAGLKLNYHWVPADLDPNNPGQVPENTSVQKLFLAVDQNEEEDRKATFGWGMEKESWFMNIQGAVGLTDERLVNQVTDIFTVTETGTIDGRPYMQDFTTTVVTDLYEQAYDYGVGARYGHWFDENLWRLTGGLDYEWGDYDSDQFTVSLNAEKYFNQSPHSFGLHAEYFSRDGDFEFRDSSDWRGYLTYRYDFGSNYRATRETRQVEVQPEGLTETRTEQKMVKHQITVSNAVLFDLDRSEVRGEGFAELESISRLIQQQGVVGRIDVVGHTCDLASEAYNQGLSERRANAVREILVGAGIDGSEISSRGMGELNPRYPNDSEANRAKNRRVEIHFVTFEDRLEDVQVEVPVESRWETQEIPQEPAWLRRALRNPAQHKRRVDTYQFQEASSSTVAGDVVFLNSGPEAADDSITIDWNSSAIVIDVLANDSDLDGDPLTVSAVGDPGNGTVVNNGDHVLYTPDPDFFGVDTFTYTVSDGNGETASASVTVIVIEVGPPNEAPQANDDTAMTRKDTAVVIDVLANDFDPNDDPLTIIDVVNTTMGTTDINSDGTVTYHPMPGWWGGDTFTYTISDPDGATSTATVTVNVLSF